MQIRRYLAAVHVLDRCFAECEVDVVAVGERADEIRRCCRPHFHRIQINKIVIQIPSV